MPTTGARCVASATAAATAPTEPEPLLRGTALTRAAGPTALGAVGSLALAVGAWRVGAVVSVRGRGRWLDGTPVLRAVPLVPVPVAWGLWWAGLAALSAAWVLLRRRTLAGLPAWAVVVAAVLWTLPVLVAPPIGSRDVYSYVAHGELARRGLDPGADAPLALGRDDPLFQAVDRVWRRVVSAYGPLATGLSEAAVRLPGDSIEATVLWWRLFAAGGVALLGIGVHVLARAHGRNPSDALALAVAGPLTIVQLVGGPHNEAVMVGLLAVGLSVALSRPGGARWTAGVALCGLGAAVKAPAVLGAVHLGWTGGGIPPVPLAGVRDAARRAAGAVVALLLAGGTAAAVGLLAGAGWGWIAGLEAGPRVVTLLSVSTTVGLALAGLLGQGGRFPGALTVTRNVVLALGVVAATVLLVAGPVLGLAALGLALTALAVTAPAVQPWYLTWGLPALAVVLAGRRVWWPLGVAIAVTASTRPSGGGVVANLGERTAVGLLAAAVVLAATAAAAVRAARVTAHR